ncbi:MAG: chalcone isomerase family protein [Sediminibacterium sp.]|nr:chalcone isomerase family protein [Sediminibacterium sp.]
MKKVILVLMVLCSLKQQAQYKIGGVELPNTLKSEQTALVINGAGVREKYFMDMYVGGLYLKAKRSDASGIVNADETMAIRLHIVSGLITSDKMTAAVDEGFKNASGGNTAPLLPKINQFKAVFKEKINKGDVYDLMYDPAKGVSVLKNGKLTTTIPGLDFKKALFGIWLCDKPADQDLKDAMLGKG